MSEVIEAPRARISGEPAILTAVEDPDCNLAIWERPAIEGDVSELAEMDCHIRFSAEIAEFPARLKDEMIAAGICGSAVSLALHKDIVRLASLFASVSKSDWFSIRLERVVTDSCRRFHGDYVPLRLITTYHGDATQWLDQADAARVANGQEPLEIRSMGAGDVGLFKGRLATRAPAIHRSPPISGRGKSRLLLVIDLGERD